MRVKDAVKAGVERFKEKQKGKLLLENNKYSILLAPSFARWAADQGGEAYQIYRSSADAAAAAPEAAAAGVLAAGCLASVDSYRRYVTRKSREEYQKGALSRTVKDELGVNLDEDEIDELYNRLT